MRKVLFSFAFVLVAILSAIGSMRYTTMHFSDAYEGSQANLRFGNLKRLQQIKSDLENGCEKQAIERLIHAVDEEKMLMAEYIQSTNDQELQLYITKRDSKLWEELKTYKVDWSKKWSLHECTRKTKKVDESFH